MRHAVCLQIAASLLLLPALVACAPCRVDINGLCYDHQDATMPPLRATWVIVDAETGKGIPGAWISLRWQGITPAGKRLTCERGVLGRTDANGRFSTVGRDGASRIYAMEVLAAGYEDLRYETAGKDLLAVMNLYTRDREIFAAWLPALEALGYHYENAQGRQMIKRFPKPAVYPGIYRNYHTQEGKVRLLVTQRALPNDPNIAGRLLRPCDDPGSINVGYEDENYQEAHRAYREQRYAAFCDARWATVSEGDMTDWIAIHRELAFAALLEEGEVDQFIREHAQRFREASTHPSTPPISHEEWASLCAALQPRIALSRHE